MEILNIFIKLILFLIGAVFLASGLFCGVIGATSLSAIWIGLIGLAFAVAGGYLIAYAIGAVGKKKAVEPAVKSGEPEGTITGDK